MGDATDVDTEPDMLGPRPSATDVEAVGMHAQLQERMFGVAREPMRLGRFVVLERIGAGGMGVVYAAYDPKLDRRIAVKLVDASAGSKHAHALVTEAQALARVAHPNVIAVHDVGEIGDRIFIAMEFVDGTPLSRWKREQSRTWREVLDVYLAAARGLAAAHAADLVHRDFKPDNVLVGRDGRVRVLDFGLARLVAAPDPARASARDDIDPGPALGAPTRHAVAGTPAYMSPEQHLGEAIDARSDQFSFCVALAEALWDEHPFGGGTAVRIADAVLAGDIRPAPRGSDVPRHIRSAILRGLSVGPDDRFADMGALVRALDVDRGRRWRSRLLLASALPVLVGLGYLAGHVGEAQPCGGAALRVQRVWDAAAEAELREAFTGAAPAYAADVTDATVDDLHAFASSWQDAHRRVCEATAVHRDQSVELLDVRMHCLDRRLRELGELVAILRRADAGVVLHAVQAVHELPPPQACETAEHSPGSEPRDPRGSEALDGLRSRTRALSSTGKYAEARPVAAQTIAAARELGDDEALADALTLSATLAMNADDAATALPLLSEAIEAADRAAADVLRGNALGLMASAHASEERFADALRHAGFARAAMRRGRASAVQEARLVAQIGWLHLRAGDPATARATLEDALALAPEGEALVRATIHVNLGLLERDLGREADASEELERALAIRTARLGDAHPETAIVRFDLATVHTQAGRHAEAIAEYEAVIAVYEAAIGPSCLDVAYAADAMAISLSELARHDEAIAWHERAQAVYETHGAAARADLAQSLVSTGHVMRRVGRTEDALAVHRRALDLLRERLGPDHVDLAYALVAIGIDLLALSRDAEAVEPLTRALALREAAAAIRPEAIAEARFQLARAIAPSDRARARALASTARTEFLAAERPGDVADVDAFLSQP